jgi:hypothetical protein
VTSRLAALLATLGLCVLAAPALAASSDAQSPSWRETKCIRYRDAWSAALQHQGHAGLGRDFLDRHAAFLESGCTREHDVCPRSPEELALANVMVMSAMNFGTASTFPPFACR